MRHSALAAVTGFAALVLAVPALAQTVDELTVTGHALRNNPQTLSETVSYADLDLTIAGQRTILERRVNAAAGRVCDRLNEARRSGTNLGHSCQEVAVRDAMPQMRVAYAAARSGPAYAAAGNAAQASATVPTQVASGPIPDTPENRARYGAPLSRAGRHSAARGN